MKRFLAVAAALASLPAWADRPPAGPRSAMQVEYRIENAQSMLPSDFTVLFAPGGQKARVTFAGEPGYLLLDLPARHVTMVMEQPKISMDIPMPALLAPYFNWRDGLVFTRGGMERDAGYMCQDWTTATAKGRAELCVTGDGLPLRVRASGKDGSRSEVVAVAVRQGQDNPAAFDVPQDHPNLTGMGFSPFAWLKGD
jgi:hypothetical protein